MSGFWSDSATWGDLGVPGASDAATINAGTTVTLDSNAQVSHLFVESGGVLAISEGSTLSVAGQLANNGTPQQTRVVSGASDVAFLGTGGYGGVILNANGLDLGGTQVIINGNQDCTGVAGETVKRSARSWCEAYSRHCRGDEGR